MKKRKLFLSVFVLAVVSFVLAACGSSDDSSSGSDSDGGKKKITGGTEATFAPFESLDDKGNIVGIDVDILDAISEELGIEYELKHVGWDPVFEKVRSGELDFGASGITVTKKRLESFDFTDPYYEATQVIVVKEDSPITSAKDLEGKKISVQINTTGHEAAKKLYGETNKNISAFENLPLAIQKVIDGATDAAIGDNAVVAEYLKNNPNKGLKVIEDDAFDKEYYAIMVKKGNKETLDLLNEGIKKIKEDGKLKEITGQELDVTLDDIKGQLKEE